MSGISIVIPLYNKANHIGRCISSIHHQEGNDYEIVLVDDGSTDNGLAVARRLLRPTDKVIVQSNRGAASARLAGIQACSHELIAFVDADDEWLAGHLRQLRQAADRHTSAGAFGTGYYVVTRQGRYALEIHNAQDRLLEKHEYFRWARPYPLLHSSNTMVRRRAIGGIGFYPTSRRRQEDLLFTSLLASQMRIAVSKAVTAVVHLDASNRSGEVRRHLKGGPWFEGEFFERFKQMDEAHVEREWLRAYMASQLLYGAYNFILTGELAHARLWLNAPLVRELDITRRAAWLLALSRLPRPMLWAIRRMGSARFILPHIGVREGVSVRLRKWQLTKPERAG